MITLLFFLSYASVFLYGLILTAAFSGALKKKENRRLFIWFFFIIFSVQIALFFTAGQDALYKLYPLITHVPLVLILVFYCKKSWVNALVSLIGAYMFTLPRHWIGTLISILFGESLVVFYISELIITLPLLMLVYRYIAPSLSAILEEDSHKKWYVLAVMIFYYIFINVFAVYSDLLFSGSKIIIGFVASTFIMSFFIFSSLYYRESQNRIHAELNKKLLEVIVNQAQVTIDQMKLSQEQITIYRHDFHHHLAYINNYIENEALSSAKDYIKSINDGIDATAIASFCENRTVNMLLSHYVDIAKGMGIPCEVQTKIPESIAIQPVDLCVIIANAMENATRACTMIPEINKPMIAIKAYTQKDKLFLEIANPYHGEITIENDMPIAMGKRTGIGTKSIVMTVEKYHGLWEFKAKDQMFFMHVIL